MKFTERKNGYSLEDINGRTDIKFSNLAGQHTNSVYDDPNKDPQRALTVWFDQDDIAEGLRENDFLVGRAEDKWHKNKDGSRMFEDERYFIKFIAYVDKVVDGEGRTVGARLKVRVNRRTGKEEFSPKIMMQTENGPKLLQPDEFCLVDLSYIKTMDIAFRPFKYNDHKPSAAVINELWFSLDESAGGRNDFEDDHLEQKWAGVPLSDE